MPKPRETSTSSADNDPIGESPWGLTLLLLVGYWLVCFTLTHLPGSSFRAIKIELLPHQDKLVHLTIYTGLAFLLGAWCRRLGLRWYSGGLTVLVLAAAYGALDEWLQQFVPHRSMDIWDWVADLVGAFLGLSLYGVWRRLNRQRSRSGSSKPATL